MLHLQDSPANMGHGIGQTEVYCWAVGNDDDDDGSGKSDFHAHDYQSTLLYFKIGVTVILPVSFFRITCQWSQRCCNPTE